MEKPQLLVKMTINEKLLDNLLFVLTGSLLGGSIDSETGQVEFTADLEKEAEEKRETFGRETVELSEIATVALVTIQRMAYIALRNRGRGIPTEAEVGAFVCQIFQTSHALSHGEGGDMVVTHLDGPQAKPTPKPTTQFIPTIVKM